MKTLEELALIKAIQDRSWLKKSIFFKQLTSQMKDKFIQECFEQNNVAAFEELLLNLRQDKLVIRHNSKFTEEFALVVANCILQNNQKWIETKIMAIDFGGCSIGPIATKKFSDIALAQHESIKKGNSRHFYSQFISNQNFHHSKVFPSEICISMHLKRDTFDEICLALSGASNVLKPFGIEAEALGRERVCKLLDILCGKKLQLHDLNLYMNSLGKHGVVDVCLRLSNFKELQHLNLAYAMISEEDQEAAIELGRCLRELTSLESLTLSANTLGHNFALVFNSLPSKSIGMLDLAFCGIPFEQTIALAEKLKDSAIHSLYLSYNNFKGHEQFAALLLLLANCKLSLRRLDISHTGLLYDSAMELVQFFIDNKQIIRLEWLGIENRDIKDNELLRDEFQLALPMTSIKWWT